MHKLGCFIFYLYHNIEKSRQRFEALADGKDRCPLWWCVRIWVREADTEKEMGSCVNIRRMLRTKTYLRVGHTTHEVKLILTG